MLFNSWQFAVFLPVVFGLYWSLPHRYRWLLILASSYWFYMSWNVKYVVLILFTTAISYVAALLLERFRENMAARKFILTFTLASCLGVLFVFKYFNFFTESFVAFMKIFTLNLHPMTIKLLLPVGISFYTFQTLGYVIDVYRGNTQAERHFGIYAAFISFFPQLVAGPIERTNNLLPQIRAHHEFNYEQGTYGLKLMAWGFFKKLAVADVLAIYSDKVFGDVYSFKGFALVLAAFFFTVQIYCDFSGYSDIARGCAKLFGIELMENFRSPYLSASIREFWSRWHISLSTWFRDYVYIPLGGNRCGKFRRAVNVMITFIVSGLWHGANWTFVLWGSVHGLAQVVENAFSRREHEPHGLEWALRVCITFMFVMMAWVLFRSQGINEAAYIFTHSLDGITGITAYIKDGINAMKEIQGRLKYSLLVVSLLLVWDYCSLRNDVVLKISGRKTLLRWAVYMLSLMLLMSSLQLKASHEFIYFQF